MSSKQDDHESGIVILILFVLIVLALAAAAFVYVMHKQRTGGMPTQINIHNTIKL